MAGRPLVHGSTPGTYIHTPGGGGELAAGEVEPIGDDKQHRAAIGAPNDRLAASAWPAGRRRVVAAMSGRHGRNNSNAGEGRAGLGNVRVLEPEHPLGEALEVETGARSE
jgi:hypothetical protein